MPTTCLAALIKGLRGIWERYRLRAEAVQNRRDDGHGRVYAWGQDIQETHTAQGHKRSTKETRSSVRIAGSRRGQPARKDYRLRQRRRRRRHLRAQGTPEAYGKVGNAMRQEKSHLYAVMVGGYYAEGDTDFYTTAERRGTDMKKGI